MKLRLSAGGRLLEPHRPGMDGLTPDLRLVTLIFSRGPEHQYQVCLKRERKVVAGLFAAATDLGADAAVLVVSGMQFALLGGGEAGCRAGFEHRGEKAEIRRALPRHDTTGCVAGIGAVEADSQRFWGD